MGGESQLTDRTVYVEAARSYLVHAASPEKQADGFALMCAEIKAYDGVEFTPEQWREILPEPLREVYEKILPLLTARGPHLGRRPAHRDCR